MKRNLGSADVFVRFMAGLAFFFSIFINETGPAGMAVLALITLVLWISCMLRSCPLYSLLNISTASKGPTL
jgi:hypothetical protein